MPSRVYGGRSARTRREPVLYRCPCGHQFRYEVWRSVDSADAHETQRLKEGMLNRAACPSCGSTSDVHVPVIFHDLDGPRLCLVLPDSLRHRELDERAAMLQSIANDREPVPNYVSDAPVVFGANGLRNFLSPPAPAAEPVFDSAPTTPIAIEPAPAPAPDATPVAPAPVAPAPVEDREPTVPRAAIPRAKKTEKPAAVVADKPPSGVATRVRVSVPDPRSAMIERWIAGREGPTAFLIDDQVLVCASLAPARLENFVAGPVELRVQLHRLAAYPLVTITLVSPQTRGRSDEGRVLSVPLDVARAAHRVILDALGQKSALTLELYDAEYLPVVTHHAQAPLEENVRRLAADARDALERIAPPNRNFERARQLHAAPNYDQLGRAPIDLPDDELESLEKPGSVLAAMRAVARWSEPSAEAYLLEIGSVPLPEWRATRARVIRRALDVGIAVARPLVERSARDHATPLPSWPELLALQVRRFAEVSARVKPNDLSAGEEAENWQHLLAECERAGVIVESVVLKTAQGAVKRARAGSGGGVDLRTLDTAELEALLERRELRREAALVLCERRESPTLPTLFSAIRRMQRNEANVVLPATTSFGPAAEKWLIDGLKSRRSFMRQGCALALGALKTPLGVDALVKLLLFEPTEIWPEVARALGDIGAQAVMPLAARLREVDDDRRERVVLALAHVAAHGVKGPVEMLAAGRDKQVADSAQQALSLTASVHEGDEAMRKGLAAEQTVVRGFSRRFYEALGGSIELGPDDLVELDETSADADEPGGDDGPEPRPTKGAHRFHDKETTDPTPKSTATRDT